MIYNFHFIFVSIKSIYYRKIAVFSTTSGFIANISLSRNYYKKTSIINIIFTLCIVMFYLETFICNNKRNELVKKSFNSI